MKQTKKIQMSPFNLQFIISLFIAKTTTKCSNTLEAIYLFFYLRNWWKKKIEERIFIANISKLKNIEKQEKKRDKIKVKCFLLLLLRAIKLFERLRLPIYDDDNDDDDESAM